ncbi:MAG: cysteine--tRNA ligase [Acidobacteria bacterium]|nr:cysteine--tRNA ligase [Acidobacteriota bacterium]
MLRLYNTLSSSEEEFRPVEEGVVRFYSCGPTVYDYAHIGNFRTFVFQDLLRRYLRYSGYRVLHVMNITDVDDKTIRNARAEGVSLRDYTSRYTEAFLEDSRTLRIDPPDVMPRATDHIPEMVALIRSLEEKGFTYRKDGSIYFDIARFEGYGKLSKADFSGAQAGARVDSDKYDKANARDFVLWKAKKEGEDFWETELGPGRPGWHIECSAMSMKYLGETFDIHCGGIDLVFPHHENEIAQSECATGRPFARYWVHPEFLIVEGEKMSKSLGNFFTLRDLVGQGYTPEAIRYLLLSVHYRKQLNFTMDGLRQAAAAIARLEDFLLRAREKASEDAPTPEFEAEAAAARRKFREAMDSDINTSAALGALFDFVRAANQRDSRGALTGGDARLAVSFLEEIDGVLGILRGRPELLDEEIARRIEARQEARRRRDFAEADRIRDELLAEGIQLEDTREGVRWKRATGEKPVK